MTTPVHLFSYGTLQLPRVQVATFGRLLEGRRDAIVGYQLDRIRITDPQVVATSGSEDHPVLIPTPDPSAAVEGSVFEITEEELEAADSYEVDAYVRIRVTLRSGLAAWVYVLDLTRTTPRTS